jgi:uncharacterized oligopeptide transporter (OPT) family protein
VTTPVQELELVCVVALLAGLYLAFGLAVPLVVGGALGVLACEWLAVRPRARQREDAER